MSYLRQYVRDLMLHRAESKPLFGNGNRVECVDVGFGRLMEMID
jgi:hypothetical protein